MGRLRVSHMRLLSPMLFALLLSGCGGAEPDSSTTSLALSASPGGAAPIAMPDASIASQILTLTNQNRAANGVGPVVLNTRLSQAAQAFAESMGNQNFFSHTSPNGSTAGDRITAAGYSWATYAENIGRGYVSASDVMNGWMNSSGHRTNILNGSLRELGVGVYSVRNYAGQTTTYWVQDFGTAN